MKHAWAFVVGLLCLCALAWSLQPAAAVEAPTVDAPVSSSVDRVVASSSRDAKAITVAAPPTPDLRPLAAVLTATDQIGIRYRWGGSSPASGFDCSGLTSYAWAAADISLPHRAAAQYAATTRIERSELRPGDLVFYGSPISHVALYVGDGQIVHAPNSRSLVRHDSIDYWDALVGFGRVLDP